MSNKHIKMDFAEENTMHLDLNPYWLTDEGIKKVEHDYGAVYMGYWCTKHSAGWWNESPVDVFYQPNPDRSKGHTNYFGMFVRDGQLFITNAESAFSEPLMGVMCEDGEVLVSRYRHDCVIKDGAMVDGGRDYLRHSGDKLIKVMVDGDKFTFEET